MMRRLLLVVTLVGSLAACAADPGEVLFEKAKDAAFGDKNAQACADAQDVTDRYTDEVNAAAPRKDVPAVSRALKSAAEDLRDIEADEPVRTRLADLVDALNEQDATLSTDDPDAFERSLREVERATRALAEDCGSSAEMR